ncbi:MAG: ImmA/IrrE family metallo-endopeptidase [Anaerobutyricum hallii]|nr:ImmA/IrrE family metallo-endopeptidase [Anaerobutyricum hallii]
MINGMNAILVLCPLKGVRGFYQYFQRNNIIYIDEALSDTDKAFVLAHEIGHMLLHKKSNAIFMDTRTQFKTTRYELEADKFAMELLISDEFLEENSYYTVEQISRMTGYPQKLIELRLNN